MSRCTGVWSEVMSGAQVLWSEVMSRLYRCVE